MSLGLIFSVILYFYEKDQAYNAHTVIYFSLLVTIPLLLFISYKVYKGDFTDYDVSNRLKRNELYRFILILFGLLCLLFFILKYPIKAQLTMGSFFLLLFISSYLNKKLKVSMHTSFNFLFAHLLFHLDLYLAIVFFAFGFLNGYSRIKLGRHKNTEVIAGFLLGNFVGILFTFLNFFLK